MTGHARLDLGHVVVGVLGHHGRRLVELHLVGLRLASCRARRRHVLALLDRLERLPTTQYIEGYRTRSTSVVVISTLVSATSTMGMSKSARKDESLKNSVVNLPSSIAISPRRCF